MKIYLISLPESQERRNKLQSSFPTWYSKFTIIDAINGKKLPAKEYFDRITCLFNKKLVLMTPSEVGCALSHMKAYEDLIHSAEDWALVLEDDVIGTDGDIEKILQLVPVIIKTFGNNFIWITGGMEGLSTKYAFAKKTAIPEVLVVHKFSREYIFRTVCYVITKTVASKILENQRKCLTVADWWDEILPKETMILYSKILKHPLEQESSIHLERIQVGIPRAKILIRIVNIVKEILVRRFKRILLRFESLAGYKRIR